MKSLGNRMKHNYENRSRYKLNRRTPVIMRLDGKSFHTLTRHCEKPFDYRLQKAMEKTALYLCNNIQGCKMVYTQSDEISLLITDYDTLLTDAWFDYNIQKMSSVSAAMASVIFSLEYGNPAFFDSRVFNVPKEEVINYFIWRQTDWQKNSVQMLARTLYSHKELYKKSIPDMHEMLHQKNTNWATLDNKWKNGTFIYTNSRMIGDIRPDKDFHMRRSQVTSYEKLNTEYKVFINTTYLYPEETNNENL